MKIIYLCNKKHVQTKMSRVRFHAMKELGKLVYVKWWGIGYDGYDNEKTVQENLDTLEFTYDMAISYKPLEMKEFKNINIPKCIRYNEMFDIDLTRNEIIDSGADLVICHHKNEMRFYDKNMENVQFKHIAHCANKDIFKPLNLEKDIDLLLIGSIWDRYPLRIRMAKILQTLSGEFKTQIYQHPGYDLQNAHNDEHLHDFVRTINRAKIAVTCTGKYRCRYGKLVEVPMCKTALACDIPEEEENEFNQILIQIDNSMTDEEITDKLRTFLRDDEQRKQKEDFGHYWAQRHTQELYAKRLMNTIYEFLGRDPNEDHNIQSLWIGDKLSNMEILSMKSFLHNNHNYHLYTYGDIGNVPEGVLVKDGNKILPEKDIFRYQNGSVSAFSNVFRYKMLFEKGGYWVDTDLVCLKPFDFKEDYVFATEPWDGYKTSKLNPCILKAPRLSLPMLNGYKYCIDRKGDVLSGKIEWDLGPSSLLDIVKNLNLYDYMKEWTVFNLFGVEDWHAGIMSVDTMKQFFEEKQIRVSVPYYNDVNDLPKNNYAVHFYNEVWRSSEGLNKSYKYNDGCLYEQLKEKYHVNNNSDKKVDMGLVLDGNNVKFNINVNDI